MTPLQWFRWRLGTYRAAIGTVRHIQSTGSYPVTLVDAGARNSEFMRVLHKAFPSAEVHSFEMDRRHIPIGERHTIMLGNLPGHRLSEHRFRRPSMLKVDCNGNTVDVLNGADLQRFDWVVVEVSEDGNGALFNNRSQINDIMSNAGFNRSKAVDAVVCIRTHRIAQTDVLFWKAMI